MIAVIDFSGNDGLKKAASSRRAEIAALKRRSHLLEQELRHLKKSQPAPASQDPKNLPRFSAKALASQRQRLGLSAEAVGLLLGASSQSVYNWEAGKARPRPAHLAAIAALRELSKSQAAEVLASRKTTK